MGLLSAIGRMAGRGARRAAPAMDDAGMRAVAGSIGGDPQGQAFLMRLQQRADELRAQPFLPPRLRMELQETEDLLRRAQGGGGY